MADFAGVYRITNTVNGKVYIGSSNCVARRLREHKNALLRKAHGNSYLQNAWNKHGAVAFVFEPLLICAIEQVLFYEQLLIDGFKAVDRITGYNRTPVAGNKTGSKHSVEAKAKMSVSAKKRKATEETKAKISIAGMGRKATEETKLKLSAAKKGRFVSAEEKAKISATKTGKPGAKHTEESKAKISRSHMGIVPSAESREKMRASRNAYVARMLKENGN